MGYRVWLAGVAVAVLIVSCGKMGYYMNVNLDMPFSQEFSSPEFDSSFRVPEGGEFYSLPALAVVTDATASMQKKGLNADKIIAIRLKSFCQKISNSDQNFDFVDSLQIYISATELPEILMAEQNDIPDNTDSISFDCIDQNLKNYLLKDTIFLRVQGRFYRTPHASTFKTDFKFGATANVLKLQ